MGECFFRTDLEILQTSLGLGAPQFVSGNLNFAHGVVLFSVSHCSPVEEGLSCGLVEKIV